MRTRFLKEALAKAANVDLAKAAKSREEDKVASVPPLEDKDASGDSLTKHIVEYPEPDSIR